MNMLEKAARAVQVASTTAGQKGDLRTRALPSEVCTELVRAVLAAIREPDEGMKHAGANGCGEDTVVAECAWHAMIDAILQEKTDE